MPVQILLVEDNPGDVRLVREVLLGINDEVRLLVASDGVEAVEFLQRKGRHIDAPGPDIILLDLNLPKMYGHGVLAYIKSHSVLRSIPVVVLTSSDAQADIVKSYHLQASCYLKKPGTLNEFERLIKSFSRFWLTHVTLPGNSWRRLADQQATPNSGGALSLGEKLH
jgi:two-component system, chemotaxis family, response regulator Rcp1